MYIEYFHLRVTNKRLTYLLTYLSCFKIYTSWNKISTLNHTLLNIIHFNDIILFYIHTHTSVIPIHSLTKHSPHSPEWLISSLLSHSSCFKIYTSWNKISNSISYFTQHHSFQLHHSLYIHTHTVSFHPSITKTFTAFTRITRIISIISFILFLELHILEQDIHSISYFIQHHSFQWHHSLLYPHSYRVSFRFIHQRNIHRIHQNNSYHHHYLIHFVSRSTHLGTRFPPYIILYWTSFISMTSFHSISTPKRYHSTPFLTKAFTAFTRITRIITIISFILFQDLHILEQDIHSISYFIEHHSFQWHHSLYIHTHTVSFHSFITKTFPAFTWITPIITIISFILFQDLHILDQDLHFISYFIQHHSFQWHHSRYIHTHTVSIHSFITKTFTAFNRITRIITIISFILFQDLHILEQDIHSISYFTQHHSFQLHHSLYIHTHIVSFHPSITRNIHRIHLNNSYHHHYLIYLVSRSTHLGTRYSLYIILHSTSFI